MCVHGCARGGSVDLNALGHVPVGVVDGVGVAVPEGHAGARGPAAAVAVAVVHADPHERVLWRRRWNIR